MIQLNFPILWARIYILAQQLGQAQFVFVVSYKHVLIKKLIKFNIRLNLLKYYDSAKKIHYLYKKDIRISHKKAKKIHYLYNNLNSL